MVSNDDDWDIPIDRIGYSTFPLSRYLEHTNNEIAYKFSKLDNATLENLKSLPCVFMTELENNQSHIRIGEITKISVDNINISYGFKFTKDFGLITLDEDNLFRKLFLSGRWEIHRTHWAIKDLTINELFKSLDLSPDNLVNKKKQSLIKSNNDSPTVSSVEGFLRQLKKITMDNGTEIFYRGHGDIKYKLEPSILRKNENGDYLYLPNETQAINELLTAHPNEFHTDHFMLDKLVRMQHFGLPTRLLDVTANPLVALYFCCSDPEKKEVDGDIKIFKVKSKDIKFYNSDTVSCITNLSMLGLEMKNSLTINNENEQITNENKKKLLHFIQAEKPYFSDQVDFAVLKKIILVKGRNANPRISSQSGAFLLFGHDAVLPDTGHSNLNVENIVVKNKSKILDELEQLNIKSSTIFPGIEQTAREIAKKYKIE